jgi:type I restriction enzyme, S subunit
VAWRIARIQLARINTKLTNGFVGPTRNILREEGVRYLQSLHIKGGRIIFDTPYFVSEEWSADHRKSLLKTGDVLVVQTGDIGQIAVVTDEFAGCNCHALIIVSSKRKMINGFFLSAVLRSHYGFHSLKSVQTGALHPHLNCTKIRDIYLPIPPLEDQRAILTFLDLETPKIDRLMEARRKQVERLQEQRTAIIHHAVTKGLDGEANMKPSGVDWLGDMPVHWELWRISRAFQQIGSGTTPAGNVEAYYRDGNRIWINTGDLNDSVVLDSQTKLSDLALETYSTLKVYPAGSLLVAMYGATIGKVGILGVPACVNQACCVLVKSIKIITEYAFYWFLAHRDAIVGLSYGGGQPNISQQTIRSLKITVPPKGEQQAVVAHIHRETEKIDTLISKYEREIELLAEYRASLISHAVTGKIDVRGLVSLAQPKEVEAA